MMTLLYCIFIVIAFAYCTWDFFQWLNEGDDNDNWF